jgi:hypothetical protein
MSINWRGADVPYEPRWLDKEQTVSMESFVHVLYKDMRSGRLESNEKAIQSANVIMHHLGQAGALLPEMAMVWCEPDASALRRIRVKAQGLGLAEISPENAAMGLLLAHVMHWNTLDR